MELEFRHKDGTMFAKMNGKMALTFYNQNVNSRHFVKKIEDFVNKGSFTCLISESYGKFGDENLEIWLKPLDYVKIIP